VAFRNGADDAAVAEQLGRSRALIFAGEEDLGMVMVEALAAGTPVIAWRRGGAAEIVEDGVTGILFEEATPAGVGAAIERFETVGITGDPDTLRRSAERFAADRFAATLSRRVDESWRQFRRHGPRFRPA
jgi:glycosyltransferase involved in cell wall biosynthesis